MFFVEIKNLRDGDIEYLLLDDCVGFDDKMESNWSLHHRDVTLFSSLEEAQGYAAEVRDQFPDSMEPTIRSITEK